MAVELSVVITQNSQSVTNNTSNVTFDVNISWTNGEYNKNTGSSGYITIEGTKYNFTSSYNEDIMSSGSETLYSVTLNIPHNSDGTKTVSGTAYYNRLPSSTISGYGIKTLTKINKVASTISSITACALGGTSTIKISRNQSAYTHTLMWKCGSTSGTIATKSTSTTFTWQPSYDLANQNTTGTKLTITYTLTTYNGSTKVGTTTKSSSEYTIPDTADFRPTASWATLKDSTGYSTKYGKDVQGQSDLYCKITAEGAYGSTITSYKTTYDGKTFTESEFYTGAVQSSGDLPFVTTVTDSRGRTATLTATAYTYAYSYPKINSLSVTRCDANGTSLASGAYLRVDFNSAVTALGNKNTAAYEVQYKKKTETEYTSESLDTYANQYTVTNGVFVFPAETSSTYDVLLTVTDDFGSASKLGTGSSQKHLWSILKGKLGITFGGTAEKEGFAVKFDKIGIGREVPTNGSALSMGNDGQVVEINGKTIIIGTQWQSWWGNTGYIGIKHDVYPLDTGAISLGRGDNIFKDAWTHKLNGTPIENYLNNLSFARVAISDLSVSSGIGTYTGATGATTSSFVMVQRSNSTTAGSNWYVANAWCSANDTIKIVFQASTGGSTSPTSGYVTIIWSGASSGGGSGGTSSAEWVDLTPTGSFKAVNEGSTPRYKVVGDIVNIKGSLNPTTTITSTQNQNGIQIVNYLPEGCRPSYHLRVVCQGSYAMRWCLHITPEGQVLAERYGYGEQTFISIPTNYMLSFNATYMV